MLLDLLSSDAYLVFHIKINEDSCDLLFDALFISLDPKLHVQITEQKIGNNVSEFTHSKWMTKSYYSSPKHVTWLILSSQLGVPVDCCILHILPELYF